MKSKIPKFNETIVITRHAGAVAWLNKHYPEFFQSGTVKLIEHAQPDDLVEKRVIGTLPINLAALCGEYWHLTMNVPAEYRGKELSAEDMEQFGCSLERFFCFNEKQYVKTIEEAEKVGAYMRKEIKVCDTWTNAWAKYHAEILEKQIAFSQLSREEREAAYAACRARDGTSHLISIDELIEMHEILNQK